ncbi:MAG: hypothetical protein Tsb0017_12100 [Geothermobacteraceae bacterium]
MSRPLHAVIVSALVRNDSHEILLIRHPKRGWELPQGHVEAGESLDEALRREVLEETGYQVEPEGILALLSKRGPEPSAVIVGFAARLNCGTARTSEESLEVGWFREEEARALPEHPVNRDRLALLLDSRDGLTLQAYHTGPYRPEPQLRLKGNQSR